MSMKMAVFPGDPFSNEVWQQPALLVLGTDSSRSSNVVHPRSLPQASQVPRSTTTTMLNLTLHQTQTNRVHKIQLHVHLLNPRLEMIPYVSSAFCCFFASAYLLSAGCTDYTSSRAQQFQFLRCECCFSSRWVAFRD